MAADDDHIFDHHSTPADLVIWRFNTEYHTLLHNDIAVGRVQCRKLVRGEPYSMTTMRSLVFRQGALPYCINRNLKQV